MSIERVRAHFKTLGIEGRILEFDQSSATVELAAKAVGVEPARIAKTLSFMVGEVPTLVVFAGDARVDNKRFKTQLHTKAKMLSHDDAARLVGHAVGGVCPFAVNEGWPSTWTCRCVASRRSSRRRGAPTAPLSSRFPSWSAIRARLAGLT